MAISTIPLDPANPGQVFACYGLAEATNILLGSATAAFDWDESGNTEFSLEVPGDVAPVERVLRFLDEVDRVEILFPQNRKYELTKSWKLFGAAVDTGLFPCPAPDKPARLPARLVDGDGKAIVIEHWVLGDSRDDVKFWAGMGGYPGAAVVRSALVSLKGSTLPHINNPFELSANLGSTLRFDSRCGYVALGIGFSLNQHKSIVQKAYPVVDVLAAIGLTHARPCRHGKLHYSYRVVGKSGEARHSLMLLRLGLGVSSHFPAGIPSRTFQVCLEHPGKDDRYIANVEEDATSPILV